MAVVIIAIAMLMLVASSSSDPVCPPGYPTHGTPVSELDKDLIQFALNLEFLEAELFMWSAFGYGLDHAAPELVNGGPPPIAPQKANLDPLTRNITGEFGLQEIGHVRSIIRTVGGFPRPLLNLSAANFATIMNEAFGYELEPPFNPYRDPLSYMLGAYTVPYVGLLGYVGANPFLTGYYSKRLVAGLLGVEAGQDAVVREYLYERAGEVVWPHNHTVAEFTRRISELRNRLAKCGVKDEGIIVPVCIGAENRTESNVLSADPNSLSYSRTPPEILRIVYGTGDEHVPGGFFPRGGRGKIATHFLQPKPWI
ncbi:desiccation-related protein PCC13-62-like [Salvia hispanica]|uniref:desiccation-related protein PCC13-62-like n=1 Tax=Salvia hispanica TaxID=49212 RepID=UPI0020094359|nr:desiccation-related protein PCC13-62-like [Salvia hispanica]